MMPGVPERRRHCCRSFAARRSRPAFSGQVLTRDEARRLGKLAAPLATWRVGFVGFIKLACHFHFNYFMRVKFKI